MAGYTRADSVNNIADGNIINAADLDGEFDALATAFGNSTGHVHDGSAANGAPITKLGPTQDVVVSASTVLPKTTATVDIGSSALKFKDFYFSGAGSVTGTITAGGFSGPHNGTVGATTASTGAFTTLSASSTVSGAGFSTYLASPPAIGGTAAAAGAFTTLSASGVITSTVATGTAPFTVSSTTQVANLNAATAGTAGNVTGTVAVANGGTNLTSGTSGGILYYSATGTLASSALLAASAIVLGGGAGVAPATTTTGTGVVTALGVNVGSAGAFVTFNGALGTPSSATLSSATGLPISTGVSGLGTGVATALAVNVGSAGAFVTFNGALGTPSSGTLSSATGLPISTGVSGLGTGVATALASNANAAAGFPTGNGTATLTNKRIDPRTSSSASTATLTPDISSFDQYNLTAQAVGLTIAAPTGTPVDGNRITIRILDNGTAQTLTWNATYTVIGVTLPTTTTATKMVYIGCVYNSTNTRWDVVAVTTQA